MFLRKCRPLVAIVLLSAVLVGPLSGCKRQEPKFDPDAAKKELQKLNEERQKEPWPK